jgi:hypothetical protein
MRHHRAMGTDSMLAAVAYQAGFGIDAFLATVAHRLQAEGMKLAGVIQDNAGDADIACSRMSLVDLAASARFRISQDLGALASGCRLDPRGLIEAESKLVAAIGTGADLVVLNKFGRAEAEGGGLRNAFVRAIETGVPVLTAVRPPYMVPWARFHGTLAVELPPDFEAVCTWCRSVARRAADQQRPRAEIA